MRINKIMIKIFLSTVVIIAILGTIFTVKAATGSMSFSATPSEVKQGENFIIVLNAQCGDGINGVLGEFEYDEEKIELVDKDTVGKSWVDQTGENETKKIFATAKSTEIKSADIYKFEFKVKNTVAVGEKISVLFKKLKINAMGSGEYVDIANQTVTLNVVGNAQNPTPTPNGGTTPTVTPTPTPTGGTRPNPTGATTPTPTNVITPTTYIIPTGASSVTPTGGNTSTITPSGNKNNNGREVVVYTDDDNTTNTTSKNATSNTAKSSTSTLPYTGMSSFIIIGIVLVAIASVGLYFVYGRYRGI